MPPSTVLLNDFKRQWDDTGPAVLAAVEQVGKSGWYVLGERVASFERALASLATRRFAVGCASGMDALEIALRSLDLRAGERVLTTPLSAFATTLAIVRAGGVPVFADVDARGNLDLAACEALFEKRADISVAMPVHLYGHPVDLEHLARLKQKFGLRVVEDCAQSIGARSRGRAAGSVGDVAAFSFYPTKNLGALGDGGALAADLDAVVEKARSLRNYGQTTRYNHVHLGFNSRLDELHAAVLESAFLPKLPEWNARRTRVAARYLAGISNPRVKTVTPDPTADPIWHLFPVLVGPRDRGAFQEHLQRAAIQTAVHYPILIPDQRALAIANVEVVGDLARAREFAEGEVSLPIHPYLMDDEIERVIAAVNDWRGG